MKTCDFWQFSHYIERERRYIKKFWDFGRGQGGLTAKKHQDWFAGHRKSPCHILGAPQLELAVHAPCKAQGHVPVSRSDCNWRRGDDCSGSYPPLHTTFLFPLLKKPKPRNASTSSYWGTIGEVGNRTKWQLFSWWSKPGLRVEEKLGCSIHAYPKPCPRVGSLSWKASLECSARGSLPSWHPNAPPSRWFSAMD